MYNATGGEHYDFKDRGIENRKGTEIQYRYRGSVAKDGKIGSARDFGNIGAGAIAGLKGNPWFASRIAFDLLETYQKSDANNPAYLLGINPSVEGTATQNAQRVGYETGIEIFKKNSGSKDESTKSYLKGPR